jgi:hypothetical protein
MPKRVGRVRRVSKISNISRISRLVGLVRLVGLEGLIGLAGLAGLVRLVGLVGLVGLGGLGGKVPVPQVVAQLPPLACACKGVTRVLQEFDKACYKSVTRVLQERNKSVTRVLQECYESVTRELQESYSVTKSVDHRHPIQSHTWYTANVMTPNTCSLLNRKISIAMKGHGFCVNTITELINHRHPIPSPAPQVRQEIREEQRVVAGHLLPDGMLRYVVLRNVMVCFNS